MVSNNILTILLLFVLGYIIYFLTRPSGYDNVPCKKMNYVNNNYAEYENFTTDAKVSDPLVNSIMEKQATQINTQPDNYIDTVKPTNIVLNANQSDMFNYEYNDTNLYNYGADTNTNEQLGTSSQGLDLRNQSSNEENAINFGANLDKAFDNQFNNNQPVSVAPTVDLNKGNVSKYDAKDYLPKEINDQWFDTDFSQAKFNINDDKLINTEKYVIGINTVGQSLKNASYDIRGTIANPKFTLSPWNNSTYEPDYNLKPLC